MDVGLMENLVSSTASQLDSQGCLAKLLCHLRRQEGSSLSSQELLLLQIFGKEKDKGSAEMDDEQDTRECGVAMTKCPVGESELLEMLRLTQRCVNIVL